MIGNYVYLDVRHCYWYSYSHANVIRGLDMDSEVMHMHIQ